jgi:hypothetical protein
MARIQDMSRAYRFTLTMPACVRVYAIGLVDPAVSGSFAIGATTNCLNDLVRQDALARCLPH